MPDRLRDPADGSAPTRFGRIVRRLSSRNKASIPDFKLIDAGFPVPRDSIVSPVVSAGALLRVARWMAEDKPGPASDTAGPPGTVLICTGRSEFIEKYFEVVDDLRGRGFAVVVFDWRGQGLSGRALRNRRKGHVLAFGDYGDDLGSVVRQVLEPFCPKPWYGLAHSMGGTVALSYAADHPHVFERLVLSAPMIEIARLPFADTLRSATRLMRFGGLSRSFVPLRRIEDLVFGTLSPTVLTSDKTRSRRTLDFIEAEPRLAVGSPTIGWLHAAFVAMARLHDDAFPLRFRTPTLVINPGADRVVDPSATERLMSRLRATRVVPVPLARHEILMERDLFREQFWAAFDAFVPGLPTTRATAIHQAP